MVPVAIGFGMVTPLLGLLRVTVKVSFGSPSGSSIVGTEIVIVSGFWPDGKVRVPDV